MINFNEVSEVQIKGKQVEQIAINGVIVWGQAVWYPPIPLGKNLYVRSVLYQSQNGTNLNMGLTNFNGGEED